MTEWMLTSEEVNHAERFQFPHLIFSGKDLATQAQLAFSVLTRKPDDILLATSHALESIGFLAGLNAEQAEEILKRGPQDYKENILKAIKNQEMVQGVMSVAQAMDQEMGRGTTQNQRRASQVLQYFIDNRAVLQF